MRLFEDKTENKIEKSIEILGIKDLSNKELILNEVFNYVFKQNNEKGKKTFDMEQDFKYYYPDFLKYNIDLLEQDISWLKFESILQAIFLDKNSNLSNVMSFRNYTKPPKNYKTSENEYYKYMMNMKRVFALDDKASAEENLNKLWNYIEKKAGDTNE